MKFMKLPIAIAIAIAIATILAAGFVQAATLTIPETSTVLPNGEVFRCLPTTVSLTSAPVLLFLPVAADASLYGEANVEAFSLAVPFDVDGLAGVLNLIVNYDHPAPGTFRFWSPAWSAAFTPAPVPDFGYPLGFPANAALGYHLAVGPVGTAATGVMPIRVALATPEPGTLILGLPVLLLFARRGCTSAR